VPNGSIKLKIRCEDGRVVLSVIDTGIGMRPEDVPKAMARFNQVDSDLDRKFEGLGLGLSLVQALTEQHGAQLKIESELGIGTKVEIWFPKNRSVVRPQSEPVGQTAS